MRGIIHLDMDAFYASVEVLDNPSLKGKPVIVGGSSLRGVVSAASYEARKFGVHSAQPIVTARRLCPRGVFLPVRMSRYKQISDRVFEIFLRFTPLVEPLSLDEAFLDVTGSARLFGPATEIAVEIRRLVKQEIGLTVSAGVAPNKLIAKIASDMNKPDGLTVVEPGKVEAFLRDLPIGKLWGVGKATRKTLSLMGIETFGDLAGAPADLLERKLGIHGRDLHRLARGEDDRAVEPDREVKSVGAEETMSRDILDPAEARRELLKLAVKVSRRLRQHGFTCRTVTLKVKYHDFRQITRAATLPEPTDQAKAVYEAAAGLLPDTAVGREPVRLLGISLSRLGLYGEHRQASLFDDPAAEARRRGVDLAMDRIAEKFGGDLIVPATLLERSGKNKD